MAARDAFRDAELKQTDILRAELTRERTRVGKLATQVNALRSALEAARKGAQQLQAIAMAVILQGKTAPVELLLTGDALDDALAHNLEFLADDAGVHVRVFVPDKPTDGDVPADAPAPPEPSKPSLVLVP